MRPDDTVFGRHLLGRWWLLATARLVQMTGRSAAEIDAAKGRYAATAGTPDVGRLTARPPVSAPSASDVIIASVRELQAAEPSLTVAAATSRLLAGRPDLYQQYCEQLHTSRQQAPRPTRDALRAIDQLVDGFLLKANAGVTRGQALTAVLTARPELYAQYVQDLQATE